MKDFDNEMNKRMSPAMDSKNHGFNKINLGLGLILLTTMTILKIDLQWSF